MTLGKVGVIGRFRPLHNGGAAMLESICSRAEQVIIGIGSANRYNARNPFTPLETQAMMESFLSSHHHNYRIIHVPDYGHIPEYRDGSKWKADVARLYGSLDAFVSGNDYARQLLQPVYPVMHPSELVPREHRIFLSGTMVRMAMAQGDGWKGMVPPVVAEYLDSRGLAARFRTEFGLETLASALDPGLYHQDAEAEALRVQEA
ncbi:MAG TPA: adenylyltransferase/cytidyltransferase family protein [Candidatus Nanoarchaeia archaeon]|nr:adenylyltransferase/cytidyltransferase family protein [Candidatus Nanoarchaeia archaeon]